MKDALIGRFLAPLTARHTTTRNRDPMAPFLTIITRTQGLRLDTLRDVFLCLGGQSCIDFEHLVIGHKLSKDREEKVQELISENPAWLRQRIRFLKADHGNRTTPLNVALDAASGHYAAILDDDDLVFAHWVETFKTLADAGRGEVLRSVAVYQKFEEVQTDFCQSSPRAEGEMLRLYPSDFDLFSHLQENRTPIIALAFPRAAFDALQIRFDETLTTSEDWDYLIRVATLFGVRSSPEITCIYRHWIRRTTSRTDHADQEWEENQRRIRAKHDGMAMLLAEGSAQRLREILAERYMLARAVRRLGNNKVRFVPDDKDVGTALEVARTILDEGNPERVDELRLELESLYASAWWRLSVPIRWVAALTKRKRFIQPDPLNLTEAHLRMAITSVRNSTSWRMTQPLRTFMRYLPQR